MVPSCTFRLYVTWSVGQMSITPSESILYDNNPHMIIIIHPVCLHQSITSTYTHYTGLYEASQQDDYIKAFLIWFKWLYKDQAQLCTIQQRHNASRSPRVSLNSPVQSIVVFQHLSMQAGHRQQSSEILLLVRSDAQISSHHIIFLSRLDPFLTH